VPYEVTADPIVRFARVCVARVEYENQHNAGPTRPEIHGKMIYLPMTTTSAPIRISLLQIAEDSDRGNQLRGT
jgi:hypothetical protein